ncbi:MAG: dUTP diphosphatase [bacterium]|nr:dUTP diphosphatase [bacterium]MBU1918175.1 dUTP diphosphatase [bacterium]
MKLKIKRLRDNKDLELPHYASPHSSGMDLRADVTEDILLKAGERTLIPTGLSVEFEDGCELQIRPRSGLAIKHGISMVNTPGTIDADYRGEIKVIVINHGTEDFVIKRGDRIAQMVMMPIIRAEIIEVDVVNETDRGEGGFGSTGT